MYVFKISSKQRQIYVSFRIRLSSRWQCRRKIVRYHFALIGGFSVGKMIKVLVIISKKQELPICFWMKDTVPQSTTYNGFEYPEMQIFFLAFLDILVILALSWPYLGIILDLPLPFLGITLALSCPYLGPILALSKPFLGLIFAFSWPHLGLIMASSWPHCGLILVASWPHLGLLLAFS